MIKDKYDVFISYRRAGGLALARCICYYLQSRGVKCFLDLKDIRDGRFDERIYTAIEGSKYFLLLLSKESLMRRADKEDWVRKEIEHAMATKDRQHDIVPVMVKGQDVEFPEDFPEDLHELRTIQRETIDLEQHFERDIDDLLLKRMPCIGKKISRTFERRARQREQEAERVFRDRARRYKDEEHIRIDIGGGCEKLMRYAEDIGLDRQRASILIEDVNNSVNRDRKRTAWVKSHPVLLLLAGLLMLLAVFSGAYCCMPSEMKDIIYGQYISPIADICGQGWDNVCRFASSLHR